VDGDPEEAECNQSSPEIDASINPIADSPRAVAVTVAAGWWRR
jgi:hypothetical protein